MMHVFDVIQGSSAIVLGQPHGGTHVPEAIAARLNANGHKLADTDWHITRLFDGLLPEATVVRSNVHRYVIDANRDPEGASLYPGQNTTTLVPLTDFDGIAIWNDGQEPSADDVAERTQSFHAPYHTALRAELERVRDMHGSAILFDCHSIRSVIPFLFEGVLPIFNIGTNLGETCAASVEHCVQAVAENSQHSSVLNGRFKGGWATRHYGQPETGFHAIQMEISQRAYMGESPPWEYREQFANTIRPHLQRMLENLNTLAMSGAVKN